MYELLKDGDTQCVKQRRRLLREGYGATWLTDADYVASHPEQFRSALVSETA
jgi:hypothetical protein